LFQAVDSASAACFWRLAGVAQVTTEGRFPQRKRDLPFTAEVVFTSVRTWICELAEVCPTSADFSIAFVHSVGLTDADWESPETVQRCTGPTRVAVWTGNRARVPAYAVFSLQNAKVYYLLIAAFCCALV